MLQNRGAGAAQKQIAAGHILRSWQRCESSGLDVAKTRKVDLLSERELRDRRQENEALHRQSRSELEALRRVAARHDSVAIVADADGFILESIGADGFTQRASQVALCAGGLWSEKARGTNGIGAVLMEMKPLTVQGSEHYLEQHRFLDCAAAPIINPCGTIAGVLNLSAPASRAGTHALDLVELAVDQIEHRFFDQPAKDAQTLRVHTDPQLLGTVHEAILVFDANRLCAANRHAISLLGLSWEGVGSIFFNQLFDISKGSIDAIRSSGRIRDRSGQLLYCTHDAPPLKVYAVPAGVGVQQKASKPIFDVATLKDVERANRVLSSGLPALVTGETGCGKEMFSRQVHALSARANAPFVAVNCAALPETLIESELFGYEEGAFTGARKKGSKGLLREADGGFLLLDEIGDMPLPMQARLLRVLQDREITPLGTSQSVRVDFSLICATHRNLPEMVAAGKFRQDLYYRISQFHVHLLPLRERTDLPRVIDQHWQQISSGDPAYSLARETAELLAAYKWPGNYRQLAGTFRAMLALAEPFMPVQPSALPSDILSSITETDPDQIEDASAPHQRDFDQMTCDILKGALERNGGNISRAARSLGISRGTFYRRLMRSSWYAH